MSSHTMCCQCARSRTGGHSGGRTDGTRSAATPHSPFIATLCSTPPPCLVPALPCPALPCQAMHALHCPSFPRSASPCVLCSATNIRCCACVRACLCVRVCMCFVCVSVSFTSTIASACLLSWRSVWCCSAGCPCCLSPHAHTHTWPHDMAWQGRVRDAVECMWELKLVVTQPSERGCLCVVLCCAVLSCVVLSVSVHSAGCDSPGGCGHGGVLFDVLCEHGGLPHQPAAPSRANQNGQPVNHSVS